MEEEEIRSESQRASTAQMSYQGEDMELEEKGNEETTLDFHVGE